MSVAKFTEAPTSLTRASASPMSSDELPQLPATIDVTPIRMKFSASGCSARSSACVWTSTKPGATMSPAASIVSLPARAFTFPTAAMRPSRMPMSARRARGAGPVDDEAAADHEIE